MRNLPVARHSRSALPETVEDAALAEDREGAIAREFHGRVHDFGARFHHRRR